MRLLYFVVFCAILALTLAAPSEESKSEEKAVATTEKKKEDVDRSVSVTDTTWENWLSNNSWTILTSAAGVVLLFSGIAASFYYFYYLNYYNNDQYGNSVPYAYNQYQQQGYPQYQFATPAQGRSLDSSRWNFTWGQVIEMIRLAQESYEKFDYQSLDCQKKALCELSQKQEHFGETGRKISNTFSFIDTLETLPMPTVVLQYLKEYKEAVNQGRNSGKECGVIYPKCEFSIKETFVKFQKKSIGKSQQPK